MSRLSTAVFAQVALSSAMLFLAAASTSGLGQTSPEPPAAPDNPRVAEFRTRDTDADQRLSEDEYLTGGGPDERVLHRDFIVFDASGDGRLTLAEFLTIPAGQSDEQRGTIPDPVTLLSEAKRSELTAEWKAWDASGDGALSPDEFANSAIGSRIRGLEATKFADWDLDGDRQVSPTEVAHVLDMAFGVRTPEGGRLRSGTGRVVDWAMFRRLNADARGIITSEEYYRVLGLPAGQRESWLESTDRNGDGRFDYAEFALGNHCTDPVGMFLVLDADLNGRLSVAELDGLPVEWRQMALQGFRGFDDDGDEMLSLREYQLLPHCNLLAWWTSADDANHDGVLSSDEFRFMPGVPLAALAAEYFRRLDVNRDQMLSLDEWAFHTIHPAARFRVLDRDSDGRLTEAEFAAEGSLPARRLVRDFHVLDADRDGLMSPSEFQSGPALISESLRSAIPDPVVLLAEARWKELAERWGEWDRDGDLSLNPQEFQSATPGERVKGLERTTFNDWDRNHNGAVTRDEARLLLEIGFGVRTPQGELLRQPTGQIVDWRMFRQLKTDGEGYVSRDDYYQALGPLDPPAKLRWWKTVDRNDDGKFNYAEFRQSGHRTDPLLNFFDLDTDLDGRLSPAELTGLPADRQPADQYLFPGFDDDRDGTLSLREFQLTPVVNLLATWHNSVDSDRDGLMSPDEFRVGPGPELAALTAEYFRRFDVDEDGTLSLDEFPFQTTHVSAIASEIRVLSPDGSTLVIAIPDYPIICSPEISPDGKWVAVDGWKQGAGNTAAHLFVVSLETDEVLDLGIGCIPHWSADGRRIAYSRYGQGVFIRDFVGNGNEVRIDPRGWAIHFSTDGTKTAFVQEGGNMVIHDLATGDNKYIFPPGKSPYRYIEHNFCWSPDSRRICFKGHRANRTIDIGIVTVDGDDPKLSVRYDGAKIQSDFAWFPDGTRIMFPMAGPKVQLYEFDPDGDGDPVRYPQQPRNRNNGGECWSRDGKTLVYMSRR